MRPGQGQCGRHAGTAPGQRISPGGTLSLGVAGPWPGQGAPCHPVGWAGTSWSLCRGHTGRGEQEPGQVRGQGSGSLWTLRQKQIFRGTVPGLWCWLLNRKPPSGGL